jgi:hypothetical protein
MQDAGIALIGNLVGPAGNYSISLAPEEVEEFVADPAAFYAKAHGGTKKDFEDWVATDGTPRCGAKTSKGSPCRNFVAGGIHKNFEAWLEQDGGLCATHGGDNSQEARR